MLSYENAKKIGINACIEKLGRDFVMAHRDTATSAFGEVENGVFCYVGVDDRPYTPRGGNKIVLDGPGTKFPYSASCEVSLLDGTHEFKECVLP